MEQTAVDWYSKAVNDILIAREQNKIGDELLIQNLLNAKLQAKIIEKEKMIDFAFNFYYDFCNKTGVPFNLISENRTNVEDYYNRTFKSE